MILLGYFRILGTRTSLTSLVLLYCVGIDNRLSTFLALGDVDICNVIFPAVALYYKYRWRSFLK